ncbi:hypothetical protein [Achromobacter insolitus]|uniref:hypothetical protein n=1 Tax=Achromobacter insolitus TaxID=217204 RepID=UPI003B99C738
MPAPAIRDVSFDGGKAQQGARDRLLSFHWHSQAVRFADQGNPGLPFLFGGVFHAYYLLPHFAR